LGATLVFVGLLGFIAESAFDTGSGVDGENLIIFEVNGWHNLSTSHRACSCSR
jgi:hypothetical protein